MEAENKSEVLDDGKVELTPAEARKFAEIADRAYNEAEKINESFKGSVSKVLYDPKFKCVGSIRKGVLRSRYAVVVDGTPKIADPVKLARWLKGAKLVSIDRKLRQQKITLKKLAHAMRRWQVAQPESPSEQCPFISPFRAVAAAFEQGLAELQYRGVIKNPEPTTT